MLPDIRHPQSQKIRMILEYIFIHPNAKDAVGDFIGKSNFLPVDCAAQSLYEVMCFYVKRESHPSSVVNALLITIEQYRNAEVCLDYVAGQLFINSNYLSGLISRSIGISFHSFVRLLRVSFAQEMLKNTRNYSMEAIGYKSGFSNTNMFFRTFRDITGITPKNYRTGGK